MAISKHKKPIVSANELIANRNICQFPPDEGGKTRDRTLANQCATTRIIECSDREGAKIVKSNTEFKLREFSSNPFEIISKLLA